MANTKITSRVIADDAVLTAAIADDAITSALIADDVALGGNPTTTTQTAGNSTTRIATTAFVSTAISNLVDSSPAALNTLNELAAALGDDANFSTTVTNSIATKVALSGSSQTIADSGDLTIDVAGDIILDAEGNDIKFLDAGTQIGQIEMASSSFNFRSIRSDDDILFKGNDGGSTIIALTLDMSDAGKAIFNSGGSFGGNVGFGTTDGDVRSDGVGNRTYVSIIGNANRGVLNLGSTASAGADGGKLTFVNGTNAVGEIYVDPDAGSQTNGFMVFSTSNSERMRINSSGNVLIGGTTLGAASSFGIEDNGHFRGVLASGTAGDSLVGAISGVSNGFQVNTDASNNQTYKFHNGGTASMTINSSGDVAMGTTSFISNAALTVDGGDMMVHGAYNSAGISDLLAGYTRGNYGVFYSTANHIYFVVGSSYIGYISGSSGQYNVSDERLKENVATLTGTLDKVKQLRGVSHTWKDTEEKGTDTNIGMIAQEVETVYPELVGDGGLPNDNEGNAPYKSVNYAHLTSVLVEAVKELSTKLDAAEARIKTLEDSS